MNKLFLIAILIWVLPAHSKETDVASLYDFNVTTIDGAITDLSSYQGKVILVVNVASKCGFTDQYEGLEELYRDFGDKGLVILGFPCNQFGSQEPGTEKEIKTFCRLNYGVSFPMFAKIDVNGSAAHPLYTYLKEERTGVLGSSTIKWNFTKFLVDREGNVVQRFAPSTKPLDLEEHIVRLL